ncbi:MAG TPA: MBL fold metallo-hydrolase [Thermoanaerobaculia bacterium]|jgi:glyoxylase-like metal-dependent hydrolase (beta-lactamase superfamily II)/8-oxo-dGTP pyrophosphatase MutT (NUDIX family)|nr:MBL fold metallo-hydrolase [Thermoanaerobaculia bacterium]
MSEAASGNLYEAVLAGLAGAAAAAEPALPPARSSASVVPWRRPVKSARSGRSGANGLEVFWVKRGETLPFMGGWHAFPGGGLSRSDAEIAVIPPAALAGPAPPARPQPATADDLPPGILACAIRELFEETGLLLARPVARTEAAPDPAQIADARRALLGGRSFAAVLRDLGCVADASRLVYAGRWLTPPFAPLRFDNRFFLLEWPAAEATQPEVQPGELEAGAWIEPAAAWRSWHLGDVLAAPPILHLLQVLGEDGPDAGLPRLRHPVEADLGPVLRVELRPGVLMFPLVTRTLPPALTTNAYLLGFGDAVLVDPGASDPAEIERLVAALAAAQERLGRRVTAIWLTHHHPDHVAGVPALRQRLGVPVLAHPATAERLAAHGDVGGMGGLDGTLGDGQQVTLAGQGRPEAPDLLVQIVHTPGHARGHLCFLELGQRSLLAGDMVAGLGTIVVDPPEGDMDDYLASLAKLVALAPRTLFPGHGPAVKNAVPKLREYIEHRLWREARVLAAWREGRREPEAMLPTVYDDVPREAWPLAARQVLAHLARLRRAGQLDDA